MGEFPYGGVFPDGHRNILYPLPLRESLPNDLLFSVYLISFRCWQSGTEIISLGVAYSLIYENIYQ